MVALLWCILPPDMAKQRQLVMRDGRLKDVATSIKDIHLLLNEVVCLIYVSGGVISQARKAHSFFSKAGIHFLKSAIGSSPSLRSKQPVTWRFDLILAIKFDFFDELFKLFLFLYNSTTYRKARRKMLSSINDDFRRAIWSSNARRLKPENDNNLN